MVRKKRGRGSCLAQLTFLCLLMLSVCDYFIVSFLPTETEHRERLRSRPNAQCLEVFSHGWASHHTCENRLAKKERKNHLFIVAICERRL